MFGPQPWKIHIFCKIPNRGKMTDTEKERERERESEREGGQ